MKNTIYVKPHDEEYFIWLSQERKDVYFNLLAKKEQYDKLFRNEYFVDNFEFQNEDKNFFDYEKTRIGTKVKRLFTCDEYTKKQIIDQLEYDYWLNYNDEQEEFKTIVEFKAHYYDAYLENDKEYLEENYNSYIQELKEEYNSWYINYFLTAEGLYNTNYKVVDYSVKEKIKIFAQNLLRKIR